MHVTERPQRTVEEYAEEVRIRGRGMFQSKELRDQVAKLTNARYRRTVRNQQLHPEYVTDYVGTLETGFGNSQYQTFWAVLYSVEVR